VHVTVVGFTMLQVHVVLEHVPGTAVVCGGNEAVLVTLFWFTCPMLL
jgi:hypothetical protein